MSIKNNGETSTGPDGSELLPALLKYAGSGSDTLIAPSILSADFAKLGEEIKAVEAAGADIIHVDVMDGRFVPNITIGPCVVEKIRSITCLPLDIHLMIEDPGRYVADFIKAGADFVSVHVEACPHLHRNIQQIKELSEKHTAKATGRAFDRVIPAVAMNPHTPAHAISEIISEIDMILVMTVNPGFGGQKFLESAVGKIQTISDMIRRSGLNVLVEVDGGINQETVKKVSAAGARVFVAGAAIFCTPDYKAAISTIRSSIRGKKNKKPLQ